MLRIGLRVVLFACASAMASSAVADSKGTSSKDCDKAEPSYVILVPDQPGHLLVLNQNNCTYTKAYPVGSTNLVSEMDVTFVDVAGSKVNIACSLTTTAENGDKAFVRCTGTGGPGPGTSTGKWWFTGGTGGFQGIKGGGTFRCKDKVPGTNAGYTCDFTWTAKLPAPKKP